MIRLRQLTLDAMIAHAHADDPREACGVLLGRGIDVIEYISIHNIADDPTRYFRLDDLAYLKAVYEAQARGLALVGFYHSHPDGVAMPSQTDIAQSHYPEATHIIIGLAGQPLVAAWRLRYGGAERVEMVIDEALSADVTRTRYSASLQRSLLFSPLASQGAILISAAVAFILLVVMALVLLPPAPRIPTP